jgi:hypothetical protein
MKFLEFLAKYALWRHLVYLAVYPLMVIEEVSRGVRTGHDLWTAARDQHEAGWRLRKQIERAERTGEGLARAQAEVRSRSASLDSRLVNGRHSGCG